MSLPSLIEYKIWKQFDSFGIDEFVEKEKMFRSSSVRVSRARNKRLSNLKAVDDEKWPPISRHKRKILGSLEALHVGSKLSHVRYKNFY